MAFTFQPPPARQPRQPVDSSFESARERMVVNLRPELARFTREGRNTLHIRRLSQSETVFILYHGTEEAIQAKVTCGQTQSVEVEAESLFGAILDGAADSHLRDAYKIGGARLAAARACRRKTKDGMQPNDGR